MLEHTEDAQPTAMRRLVREIVHVTETREELEQADLVVDFHEIKNGNGHAPTD